MTLRSISISLIFACFATLAHGGEGSCFIKDGDRVGFFGDSITAAKVYGDVVERVFRHAHPGAQVAFINNGNSGLQLSGTKIAQVLKGDPNVITIMIGMNDAINSGWVSGDPLEPKVATYKNELTALVRALKEQDKVVVILSPTLTDETVSMSTFRLEGTERLLKLMGNACEEVAREESVYFVPVQTEFEACGMTLPRYAVLRPDGVHPCARGHYQIARSLWTHLNLTGPLAGSRSVDPSPRSLTVDLSPVSNLAFTDADALKLQLVAGKPGPVDLTWSCAGEAGTASIDLTGTTLWTLPLPEAAIPKTPGTSATAVIEVKRDGAKALFLLDLFRKPVIHARNGIAETSVTNKEGKTVATCRFSREGNGLRFAASVFKDELFQSSADGSPWGKGDALTLFLDLRDTAQLGGLGYDGDVYQVWFKPQSLPGFTPGFMPGAGRHMMNLATAYGEKTSGGYTVGLLVSGYLNNKEPVDYSTRRLIGFDLSVVYAAALGKQSWLGVQSRDRESFLFPGSFSLVDLDGTVNEDSALTVSAFPGRL